MVNAGRILIIGKGEWSNLINYEQLDLVSYNGAAYLARQASVGQNPADDVQMTYWQPFGTVSSIATTSEPGLVMPDGTTITIDATGLIQANVGISDIKDVVLTSLTGDQILRYDSSTSKWVNYSISNIQNPVLAMIATLENGSATTQAYAIGQHFVRKGKLYKAIAAIAQGANFASLAEGTDYEEETKPVEKQIEENRNNLGDLSQLGTTDKSSAVAAINEVLNGQGSIITGVVYEASTTEITVTTDGVKTNGQMITELYNALLSFIQNLADDECFLILAAGGGSLPRCWIDRPNLCTKVVQNVYNHFSSNRAYSDRIRLQAIDMLATPIVIETDIMSNGAISYRDITNTVPSADRELHVYGYKGKIYS